MSRVLRHYFAPALVVLTLTFLLYMPGLGSGFMFDDIGNITSNGAVQVTSLSLDNLKEASLSSYSGPLRRPVSMLSFALNHYFSGLDPEAFKRVNLLLHLLTGMIIYGLSYLLLLSTQPTLQHTSALRLHYFSLAVASMWLLSPINLTNVLYIVQRMNQLSSLFMFMGAATYTLGRFLQLYRNRRGYLLTLGMPSLFLILAVFSKENGALLIPLIFIIELTIFRFKKADDSSDIFILWYFILTLALPLIAVIALLLLSPESLLAAYATRTFTLTERVLSESRILMFYIQMILTPANSSMGMYHDGFIKSTGLMTPPTTLLSIFLIGLLLIGSWFGRKISPVFTLGILWFFTGHLIESTILPLELIHEHRNYLPSFGILLAFTTLLFAIGKYERFQRIYVWLPVCMALILALTLHNRNLQWSDPITHAVYEVHHHPDSSRALLDLGAMFASATIRGDLSAEANARQFLENAQAKSDENITADLSLFIIDCVTRDAPDSRWLDKAIMKLTRHPADNQTLGALDGLLLFIQDIGCNYPYKEIEKIYLLATDTGGVKAYDMLATFQANILKDYEQALASLNRAIQLGEDSEHYTMHARMNRINLLMALKRLDLAAIAVEEAAELDSLGAYGSQLDDARKKIQQRRHQAAHRLQNNDE